MHEMGFTGQVLSLWKVQALRLRRDPLRSSHRARASPAGSGWAPQHVLHSVRISTRS